MTKLAIVGSGDLGQLIAHHAEQSGEFLISGFFDDYKSPGEIVGKHAVLGGTADILSLYGSGNFDEIIIGIGYRHFELRKKLFLELKEKIHFANVIHQSAIIDPSCKLGVGIVVLPGCVLDMNVELADNVLLNTGCIIAHDSKVMAHSFLSPAVVMAGFSRIGESCNIGINTTIIDNVRIADHIQTGGATVVIKNLEEAGLYVGSPARKVRD